LFGLMTEPKQRATGGSFELSRATLAGLAE
jgi:hypothetical protein